MTYVHNSTAMDSQGRRTMTKTRQMRLNNSSSRRLQNPGAVVLDPKQESSVSHSLGNKNKKGGDKPLGKIVNTLTQDRNFNLSRNSSLRRRRSMIRVPGLKSKKFSEGKRRADAHGCDSSITKATCSSILKNSKYRNPAHIPFEGDESGNTMPIKVCTYTHCSLHGPLDNDASLPLGRSTKSSGKAKSPSIFLNSAGSLTSALSVEERPTLTNTAKNQHTYPSSDALKDQSPPGTPMSDALKEEAHAGFAGGINVISSDMQLKRDKYVRMWHFLYQNAKACVEKEDKASEITSISTDDHEEVERNLSEELSRSDAVILVKQAIDAICPPSPDSLSNNQSVTNDANSVPVSCVEHDGQNGVDVPRSNWKKLKRIILLKKFIKEIDKGRKPNRKGAQYFFMKYESDEQKVNLKHQVVGERRDPQEWMLDYALQQVIAHLTPGRKKKVELLIEAFEKVNQIQTV